MEYFYINKDSLLPTLRVELVNDAKYDFLKFNKAIQNATVTFSMWDEHGILKISNAPCNIIFTEDNSCHEQAIIEYKWNERDTKKKGQFKGQFTITFGDDIYEKGEAFSKGTLKVPIYEDLFIMIK